MTNGARTFRSATRHYGPVLAAVFAVLATCSALPPHAGAQEPPRAPGGSTPAPRMTVDALSVVKVTSKTVAGARSARTLGAARDGTGVVLDAEGLVLTIGYLILEAETVELSTADGRSFPAAVLGVDAVTGLGLLRSLRPLPIAPVEVGESSATADGEPVLIVGFDGVALAQVVSRRPFVGTWEYLLREAIYTAPATVNWSGAALLNRQGKLLGIGSLAVPNAPGADTQVPGNMFVPIDVLKPMLSDFVTRGRSSAPPRPWIGVHSQELQGNVIVTRVSPDSPAAQAPIRPGDVIVSMAGQPIQGQADFYTRLWSRGPAGTEIPLEVLRDGRIQSLTVKSIDRDSYYRLKPTY